MGGERNRKRQTDRERKWMHYLEFILARSFFAFFRAFCLSSPSFMPSEDTELSVTISTMYFFKERCSYNRRNQYMRDTAGNFMYHYLEQASEITSVSGFWCQKSVAESKWALLLKCCIQVQVWGTRTLLQYFHYLKQIQSKYKCIRSAPAVNCWLHFNTWATTIVYYYNMTVCSISVYFALQVL